jgi:ribosome maturation factor RimP
MADIARLTQLIEPEATALGFELVRVAMLPSEAGDGGMALQIMAEDPATGQLVIDQCAALSRRVSDVIDAAEEAGEELIEGAYHLEVSSPGIDRPLTREKDFANWAGHEVGSSWTRALKASASTRACWRARGWYGPRRRSEGGRCCLPLAQFTRPSSSSPTR